MKFTFAIAMLLANTQAIRISQMDSNDTVSDQSRSPKKMAAKWMEEHDTDKDGKLSWEEVKDEGVTSD